MECVESRRGRTGFYSPADEFCHATAGAAPRRNERIWNEKSSGATSAPELFECWTVLRR